ncbi:MAG: hypothetical protein ACREK6_08000, partial [Candidatus Rokuibacteriota bacterium]
YVVDDPQQVPADILERRCALDPGTVVDAPFWSALRAARDDAGHGGLDQRQLHAAVERSLPLQATPRVAGWRPERKPRRAGFSGALTGAIRRAGATVATTYSYLGKLGGRIGGG